MWRAQAHELADVRRVLTPDLYGRGINRDHSPSRNVEDMARQIVELIDGEGLDRVDLGGFSMGGYVCFAFWRLFASRVRSLALLDTRATADNEGGKRAREAMADEARRRGPEAAMPMLEKLLSPDAPRALVEEVRSWIADQPGDTLIADIEALRDRPDSTHDLAGIDVPTLVLVGEGDAITPPEVARTMADGIPKARLVTIPGAGHLSPVERPADVSSALRGFLAPT
jgi:pimeloyl-ACP methyl ester carboxylesterase